MKNYMDRYGIFMKLMIKLFSIPEKDRYGRELIVNSASKYLEKVKEATIVDIAAGSGTDLINIKKSNPKCKLHLYGLEAYEPNIKILEQKKVSTFTVNIEKDRLPFEDASVDIIVANQILEHCKELWWIYSEVSRVLKPNGVFLVGVPNLASLHCRLMLLIGKQPPCMETHGPHLRGFTFSDLKYFSEDGGYFEVEKYRGSGFYSIIPGTAKIFAKLFPNSAVNMSLALTRTDKAGTFIENLETCRYETNFYTGSEVETEMYV